MPITFAMIFIGGAIALFSFAQGHNDKPREKAPVEKEAKQSPQSTLK